MEDKSEECHVKWKETTQLEALMLREFQIRMFGRMLENGLFVLPYNYINCVVCEGGTPKLYVYK
jgi:hypothetical protein